MEERRLEFLTDEKGTVCNIVVYDDKVVVTIGDDEMIATNPLTNTGKSPTQFFDRFMESIYLEEE